MAEKKKYDSVDLFVRVTGEPAHAADVDVPGDYHIRLTTSMEDGKAASCALDVFHCFIGIKILDPFTFEVRRDGRLIHPGDFPEYTLQRYGDLIGKVEAEDVKISGWSWGDLKFDANEIGKRKTKMAIASYLAEELDNNTLGEVTGPDGVTYKISVTAQLVKA